MYKLTGKAAVLLLCVSVLLSFEVTARAQVPQPAAQQDSGVAQNYEVAHSSAAAAEVKKKEKKSKNWIWWVLGSVVAVLLISAAAGSGGGGSGGGGGY